ncbi:regulator of chromosome condensation 1/beta-lactamase-inhibitor protein II [Coprinopsis sp. MPI-PUGE-AT-0042]|nr:regulator of chromosome condensation 1/beta-lactamase-inhibitor protein II [Coprinopsis sp. MPI-PUGE-AT-0042]
MSNISGIPVEVLLDNLFPFLPAKDLTHLACTSKLFAVLCSDDTVWKRKLQADFNFTGEGTARTSGWKTIYRGLWKPRVFVWGEKANSRLGVKKYPQSSVYGVPFPFELKIPRARIVSLVAGGMSFHALDSEGRVRVWGTLDGSTSALPSDGYEEAGKVAETPHTLQLPAPVRSISCGRLHSCVLDQNGGIWTFVNWGRPFQLSSLVPQDIHSMPLQVECGWSYSAVLSREGQVFVWWPSTGGLQAVLTQKFSELNGSNKVRSDGEAVIPCATWTADFEPLRLPSLPSLPELTSTGSKKKGPRPQLVQIAGMEGLMIGLTDQGHVLKFDSLHDETTALNGRWQYLPRFSDLNSIKEHEAFTEAEGSQQKLEPPETLHITHITGNFRQFVAYSTGSSSIVLIGSSETAVDSDPQIKPDLQNRSVISVVVGDYHNAALTSDGKLFTWGSFSAGALGLGDPGYLEPGQPGGYAPSPGRRRMQEPAPVEVPTEVRFDHGRKNRKDRFCFGVTAAGWHTGALVIDLKIDEDEEDTYELEKEEPLPHSHRPYEMSEWETPPIVNPAAGIFRIGHAGARGRGGPSGRGIMGGLGGLGGPPRAS